MMAPAFPLLAVYYVEPPRVHSQHRAGPPITLLVPTPLINSIQYYIILYRAVLSFAQLPATGLPPGLQSHLEAVPGSLEGVQGWPHVQVEGHRHPRQGCGIVEVDDIPA